ncbi:hypothetical protein LCGC14_1349580, partial [marine sediment metagenome]
MNPLARYKDNPGPDQPINSHEDVWRAIRHIRLRQAVSDERLMWVMRTQAAVLAMLGII